MPGQDQTGPSGQGPLTGRGLGSCGAGLARGRGFGRGIGRGLGRGFGYRQSFTQPQIIAQPQVITETQEKEILNQELEAIKQEQAEIEKRLKDLK